ncbi:hypothetical protein KCP73_19955 [Salmonella enterica subsp. enterica]|nr:hypothetical protein KCP73_19955 [Salmonella enterica subsp. enterica]
MRHRLGKLLPKSILRRRVLLSKGQATVAFLRRAGSETLKSHVSHGPGIAISLSPGSSTRLSTWRRGIRNVERYKFVRLTAAVQPGGSASGSVRSIPPDARRASRAVCTVFKLHFRAIAPLL